MTTIGSNSVLAQAMFLGSEMLANVIDANPQLLQDPDEMHALTVAWTTVRMHFPEGLNVSFRENPDPDEMYEEGHEADQILRYLDMVSPAQLADAVRAARATSFSIFQNPGDAVAHARTALGADKPSTTASDNPWEDQRSRLDLGLTIKARLQETGKKRTELATDLGVSYGLLSAFLYGNASPRSRLYQRIPEIEKFLGMEAGSLTKGLATTVAKPEAADETKPELDSELVRRASAGDKQATKALRALAEGTSALAAEARGAVLAIQQQRAGDQPVHEGGK